MSNPKLTLVTLGGAFGMRNVSPFCLKLELLMTDLGLEFELEEEIDPRKAPKGKLPFLKTPDGNIADSELVLLYLDELTQGRVFEGISAQQKAYGMGLSRLAEEHLYWTIVASRWLDDKWWPNVVEGFFHIAPAVVRPFIANIARKQVRKTYEYQGLGLHTQSEQEGFVRRDMQALQDAITEDGYLFGNTPNVFDFTITGILAGIYDQTPPTWVNAIAEEFPALKDYADRVQSHVGVFGRT